MSTKEEICQHVSDAQVASSNGTNSSSVQVASSNDTMSISVQVASSNGTKSSTSRVQVASSNGTKSFRVCTDGVIFPSNRTSSFSNY